MIRQIEFTLRPRSRGFHPITDEIEANLPPLEAGDILIHGHTHVRAAQDKGAYYFLNPGSVSIPKGDGVRGYMVYENRVFTLKDLDGGVLATLALHD